MITLSPGIIASLFKHNFTIKLLSLALAISVWAFTVVSRESRHELVLPVVLVNIPVGYAPEIHNQNEVSFTLSGPTVLVRAAQKNNISLVLDFKGLAAPGKTLFSNLEKSLNLHHDLRVTRVSPATVEIELLGKQINPIQGERHK